MATIREHDGGRTVPGLQHGCMVFIEGLTALVHGGVLLPGLGDHHHDSLADGVPSHGQQFQTVIERCRIRLASEADGVQFLQVSG